MDRQSWLVVWRRSALLPGVCLLLLLATQARLTGSTPHFAVWLYGACFALTSGLVLATLWLPIAWLDARANRLVAPAVLLSVSFPFVFSIARHLSASDGLRARGFSAGLLMLGFSMAFSSLLVLAWAVQRFVQVRGLPLGSSSACVLALFWLDTRVGRYQGELAALVEACAVVSSVALLVAVLSVWPRMLYRLGLVSSGLVLALAVLAVCLPEQLARGQRLARVQESSIDYLDGRLARRLGLRSVPARAPLSRKRCAELLRADSWPTLALPTRRNVVLISIDSVRADHVQKRIAGQPVMPALASFMAEAQRAGVAYAAYPATALSMTAAFTGLLPSELLLSAPAAQNLFSLAQQRLDRVHAILPSGNYFQRSDVKHHLLQGAQVNMAAGARQQTDQAIERLRTLRANDQSHLLWVHYFEPHEPYLVRSGFDFGASAEQRYASELGFVDRELSRLLETLRNEGWYDDSLIIVFADHGEAFGEHGHSFHHYLLYPWLTNVPFAMRVPGLLDLPPHSGLHLTDIAPTALHFLGADRAPRAMTGRSLLAPQARGERLVVGEAFWISGTTLLEYARTPIRDEQQLQARLERIEQGPGYPSKLALVKGGQRLIWHRGSGASELYAVADAQAEQDLADQLPVQRALLEQEAGRWREHVLTRARCALQEQRQAGAEL